MHRLPRAFALRQSHRHIPPRRAVFQRPRISQTQQRWQSQTVYQQDGTPMRYQAVRIQKPRFPFRRVVTTGLYIGLFWGYLAILYRQLEIEIEFVEDEEAEQTQEEGQEQEQEGGVTTIGGMVEVVEGPMYADEESLFIPFTWGKEMPRTFYRGSDPEWQEFIKISKDQDKRKKIQQELATVIQTGAASHPSISRSLGQDVKVGHFWLDISFPDGPPPHYERQGIEIGDGYIAWSTQKVDPEQQWRTQRALIPIAAASGTWSVVKTLAGVQWRRFKQQLGLEGPNPTNVEERVRSLLDHYDAEQQRNGKSVQPGSEASVVGAGAVAAPKPDQKRGELPGYILNVPPPESPMKDLLRIDVPIAYHAFSSSLSKNWQPKKMEPPRGTFIVQGMVEVRGSRGRALFDVQSCYDPKSNKFMHVNAGVRTYKRWKQGPKGGP